MIHYWRHHHNLLSTLVGVTKIVWLAMVPQAHVASLFAVYEFYQRQRQQIS